MKVRAKINLSIVQGVLLSNTSHICPGVNMSHPAIMYQDISYPDISYPALDISNRKYKKIEMFYFLENFIKIKAPTHKAQCLVDFANVGPKLAIGRMVNRFCLCWPNGGLANFYSSCISLYFADVGSR